MNAIAYFEIQASNLDTAISFYTAVFGWKFIKQEGLPIEYYRIEGGGIHGGILKRPTKTPSLECGTNAFTCSMHVDNFDTVADLIIKNGGRVAMAKFAIPGKCWQGYFIDVDNNVFGIFQVDEKAK